MPDVRQIKTDLLQTFTDTRGSLAVLELSLKVPFTIARLFYVSGVPVGAKRGAHAHRLCSQYLICQRGRLQVDATDGCHSISIELTSGQAVLIEPMVFAEETYAEVDTTLLVLCDRPYERDDYVHTLDEFRLLTERA